MGDIPTHSISCPRRYPRQRYLDRILCQRKDVGWSGVCPNVTFFNFSFIRILHLSKNTLISFVRKSHESERRIKTKHSQFTRGKNKKKSGAAKWSVLVKRIQMVNGLDAIGCQMYPECQQISDPSVTLPLSDPATSSTNFSTTGIASQQRICNKYPPKILLPNICEKFSQTIWHHSVTMFTIKIN